MFLEIKSIEKYYGTGENRTKVLKGITTGVEKGKICVLLGPSGSGKSTLLNIIGGIEKADGGEDNAPPYDCGSAGSRWRQHCH